jgi:hypothetical protein
MTNPNDEYRDQIADRPTMSTGVQRGLDQLESLGMQQPPPAPAEPYKKEPLFSKKVLIGWGLGTLAVWFVVTMIIPSIAGAIRGAIRDGTVSTSGDNTIKTITLRNGTVITIKTGPDGNVTVDRRHPGSTAPTPAPTGTSVAAPERPGQPERPEPLERIEPKEQPVAAPATTGKK